jgi:hypothetical protein
MREDDIMRYVALLVVSIMGITLIGCEKKGAPVDTPDKPGATQPAPAAAKAGPEPSEDKEMLGLDLKPFDGWKPTWDPDAKVAKWENDDVLPSIVIRIVSDKLDTIEDLKAAAPMMMQLGSDITKVVEEQKASKGWYAVVEREDVLELVYIQKYGGKQIVCSANLNLTKSDEGNVKKEDALKACDSIQVKP